MNNDMTKPPKKYFGRSVRHVIDTQSELKSRERFDALGPIASRIRHRLSKLQIYFVWPVSPCLQPNSLKQPDILLPRPSLVRILTRE